MTTGEFVGIFLKIGLSSFGGWSTTALLLEKELVTQRKVLSSTKLNGAVGYAQMLPGATQVAIVANVGYRLKGYGGAVIATVAYLLPALTLITLFAALYFYYGKGPELVSHLGGLIAALGGIILANAYRIGARHITHWILWALVALAIVAKLWLGIDALLIIVVFGLAGLLSSWLKPPEVKHE